jgi:RHS repeat-associated protein
MGYQGSSRRLFRVGLLASAVALGACGPTDSPSGARATGARVGVIDNAKKGIQFGAPVVGGARTISTDQINRVMGAGTGWVRLNFIDAYNNVGTYEGIVGEIKTANSGAKIIGLACYEFIGWDGSSTLSPEYIDAFADKLEEIAPNFLQRGVEYWEIWNEPNATPYYIEPASLAALLTEVYARLNPMGIKVITGGLYDINFRDPGNLKKAATTYLGEVHTALGATRPYDGIGEHLYLTPNGEVQTSIIASKIENIHAYNTNVPVYITEVGWRTHTGTVQFPGGSVTEATQVLNLNRVYETAQAYSYVHAIVWFLFQEHAGFPWGLIRRDGAAKPAWCAYSGNTSPECPTTPGCVNPDPRIQSVNTTQSGQIEGQDLGDLFLTVSVTGGDEPLLISGWVSAQNMNNQHFNGDVSGGQYQATTHYKPGWYNTIEIHVIDGCNRNAVVRNTSFGGANNRDGSWICTPTCGDPVDTWTGNFFERFTDLKLPGVGDTALTAERVYRSQSIDEHPASIMGLVPDGSGGWERRVISGPARVFGPGWTFSLVSHAQLVEEEPDQQRVLILYDNGRTATFERAGGEYVPRTPGVFDSLTMDGEELVLVHHGSQRTDRFNTAGQILSSTDRNGNTVEYSYLDLLLTRVENSSGRWVELEYDEEHRIVALRAPEGKVIRYRYTGGLLTSVIDARGNTTRYEYDHLKRMTAIITPNGYPKLRQAYNANNRVAWQRIGAQEKVTFTYGAEGRTASIVEGDRPASTHRYTAAGLAESFTDPLGHTERYRRDRDGLLLEKVDRLGRTWRYEYDGRGNRTLEEGPLGFIQRWAYDGRDRLRRHTDALGRRTEYQYDGRGNLVARIDALGQRWATQFNGRGLPTREVDARGIATIHVYDPATGDLLRTTNGAGDTVSFTYDRLGRLVSRTNGRGFTTTYRYDGNDNRTRSDGPGAHDFAYSYDANNNRVAEVNPNGGTTRYRYDQSDLLVEVTNPLEQPTRFQHDDQRNLVWKEDAEGRVWTYEYDALRQRTAEHGPEDTHTFWTYDAAGRLVDERRCAGVASTPGCDGFQVTRHEYDDLDREIRVIRNHRAGVPAGDDVNVATGSELDLAGNVVATIDPNGNVTRYTYDALNRRTLRRDAEGRTTGYGYDPVGNLIAETNPRGHLTRFEYDGASRRTARIDALGHVWQLRYDHNGNLVDEIDPLGVRTHHEYDENDWRTATIRNAVDGAPGTADQNVTTRSTYDAAGQLRFVFDPRGEYRTERRYDAAGRLIEIVDHEGGRTLQHHDRVGNLVGVTDANGHRRTIDRDGLDRVTAETDAAGHRVSSRYDRLGNLVQTIDARSHSTHHEHDGLNRRVASTDALGNTRRSGYDPAGNLVLEIDGNGNATRHRYDTLGRRTRTTDAEGHVTITELDANGNRVAVTDGNGHTARYRYDPVDRLVRETNGEGESTDHAHDPVGNEIARTAPDGVVTRFSHDRLYRLVEVIENAKTGAPAGPDTNVVTRYTYDEVGNLLAVLDAEGHRRRFTYDGLNRLLREVDADGSTWDHAYDPVGNRIQRIDANRRRTRYRYGADDLLVSASHEGGASVTYAHDPSHNRVRMQDSLGTTRWTYDPVDRAISVVDPYGRELRSSFDRAGNRVSLTYPDGSTLRWGYYRNNWLERAVDPFGRVTRYARDGIGLPSVTFNPNETVAERQYDRANRLVRVMNRQVGRADQVNSAFVFHHDLAGNPVRVENTYGWRVPPQLLAAYHYDGLRRLVRVENSEDRWTTFRYDRVGNRLEMATNDDSTSNRPFDELVVRYRYAPDDRLLSLRESFRHGNTTAEDVTTFNHDANGNRTGKTFPGPQGPPDQGVDYRYDEEDRLIEVVRYQGSTGSHRVDHEVSRYAYDGDGRRLLWIYDPKNGQGGAKRVELTFDGALPVAEHDTWSPNRQHFYRGDGDSIVTLRDFPQGGPTQFLWFHEGALGSVSGLTRQFGQATHNYRYEPFGQIQLPPGDFTEPHNHYTFRGQTWDKHTGLYLWGARTYDPYTGQWLARRGAPPTLGEPASLHQYAFSRQNPLR